MRLANHVTYTLAATVLALGTVGCSTMDSAYRVTKAANPDAMTVMTGAQWANPIPNIRPVSPDKRVVYVSFRNLSGADIPMDLFNGIRASFEQSGYRVTYNPDEAWYEVLAVVRHCGEARDKSNTGTVVGAVAGGIAGGVLGHSVGHGGGASTVVGAAAGAALVGGAMDIFANRNKMVEYDLVVDVRIGERVPGGVATHRQFNERIDTTHSGSTLVAGGGYEGGSSSAQSAEDQAYQLQDQFIYHKNTLTAWARRMGLPAEEAMPVLSRRIVGGMAALLP